MSEAKWRELADKLSEQMRVAGVVHGIVTLGFLRAEVERIDAQLRVEFMMREAQRVDLQLRKEAEARAEAAEAASALNLELLTRTRDALVVSEAALATAWDNAAKEADLVGHHALATEFRTRARLVRR